MPPDRLLSGYHAGHAEGAAIEGRSSANGGEADERGSPKSLFKLVQNKMGSESSATRSLLAVNVEIVKCGWALGSDCEHKG